MGFSLNPKPTGGENSGRGLLLVFLSGENNTSIVDKTELFAPSPSSSSSSPIRRTNSSPILSKAQSTISICFLLVCVTFLLFTLSTFEPTATKPQINPSRRMMSERHDPKSSTVPDSSWFQRNWGVLRSDSPATNPVALQGMGTLYRRGTGAMSDLVVGHLAEDVTGGELRLFLRLLHRSGLTARSDLVLVFDSLHSAAKFAPVIEEENESFLKLVGRYWNSNGTDAKPSKTSPPVSFDPTQFVKSGKSEKEPAEPLWGKKRRTNYSGPAGREPETESTRVSYGSVVGFDATELDPENSLSGFVAHAPMSLRRWACYPMLLGRVRRNFKHTILVDVKHLLLLGDPLSRVRNRGSESVLLSTGSFKHGKKNSEKTRPFNSGLIIGGSRGIRRFSNAMVTEIARVAMAQHKKKSPVTESGVLSQLGSNEILLKSKGVNLVTSSEPVQDASQLNSGATSALTVIHRGYGNGNHHELRQLIMKQICSFEVDSSVYRDC